MIGNVIYPINKSRDPFPFIYRFLYNVRTLTLIASEMYLEELVALSLPFSHFRLNILTVNSQLSVT